VFTLMRVLQCRELWCQKLKIFHFVIGEHNSDTIMIKEREGIEEGYWSSVWFGSLGSEEEEEEEK